MKKILFIAVSCIVLYKIYQYVTEDTDTPINLPKTESIVEPAKAESALEGVSLKKDVQIEEVEKVKEIQVEVIETYEYVSEIFINESLIQIEQKDELVVPINGEVTLEKLSFDLIFNLSKPKAFFVNASFKNETYRLASKEKDYKKLPGFEYSGMAEGIRNEHMNVLISDDGPSYWFYKDDKENRFNKIEKKNGNYRCTRTIESFFNVDSDPRETINFKDINFPVYFVVIDFETYEGFPDKIETQRTFVKINWK